MEKRTPKPRMPWPGVLDPAAAEVARMSMLTELPDYLATRHHATLAMLAWFDHAHLPDGLPREISRAHASLASRLVELLPDGPELTVALRKLLEAKDAAVRQAIAATTAPHPEPSLPDPGRKRT